MIRLICLIMLLSGPVVAGVTYDEPTRSLTVTGQTTTYMVVQIAAAFKANEIDNVFLSGQGGDYYAGLAIGHQFKAKNVRIIIPSGTDCISACAMAAIAGMDVLVDGRLLFHRPYTMSMSAHQTPEEYAGYVGRAYADLARYTVTMGFPLQFSDNIVWNSSPCKFILVTDGKKLAASKGVPLARPAVFFKQLDLCVQH